MYTDNPNNDSMHSENNDDTIFIPKRKKLDPRFVLSGLILLIFVSSTGLAFVNQNQNTDSRSQAAREFRAYCTGVLPENATSYTRDNVLTGGSFISDETGRKLESVGLDDLGRADSVRSSKDLTRIVGGKGSKQAINARIAQIKTEIDRSDSDFDKEKLQERLAKLGGGVAVINVGAATEIELKELQERVKDAVGATKAAIEEGVVPGGGVALLRASKKLEGVKSESDDETVGIKIVKDALEQPVRWLAKNSGEDDGWVARQILAEKSVNYGFNAQTLKFGDMLEMGVLDPVKVTRSALINAASVASMILTTECLVTDIPEEKKDMPGGAPDMSGMGM